MGQALTVSIIINNYNYGQYLPEAIESALNQSYQNVEVIVVDDGSTDNSRSVIASYGPAVSTVLKENGGQASAFNAGFARSNGDVVIFLDADDILLPQTAQRVVDIFAANPGIARVHYRLDIVNETGEPTGSVIPPRYLALPDGDLRQNLLEVINCSSWSPTSGNAFARWSLAQILPMPEAEFRLNADYYLTRVNALGGPMRPLDEIGGYYRSHGGNNYLTAAINLDRIRQQIVFTFDAHAHIKRFAESLRLGGYSAGIIDIPDEMFVAQRMISYKLAPAQHPVQGDGAFSLWWGGTKAVLRRTNLSLPTKALHLAWFGLMAAAPPAVAPFLARQYVPETRAGLNKILNVLQRRQQTPAVGAHQRAIHQIAPEN